MTIKRRLPPPKEIKLPPAHLYLDDVEEIIATLKPEGENEPPVVEFTVDDEDCDSVQDLRTIGERKIGGHVDRFEMTVQWKKGYFRDSLKVEPGWRANLSVGGSSQRRIWVRNQVHGVFTRRIRLSWRLRWLAALAFVAVWLVGFHVLFHFLDRVVLFKTNPRYFVYVDIIYGLSGGLPSLWLVGKLLQSTITLKNYQEQESWFKRHRDQIILAAVIALITTIINTLVHGWFAPK